MDSPYTQFTQVKTKIKLATLRDVLAAQVWPGLRPLPTAHSQVAVVL